MAVVVEDDEDIRDLMVALLGQSGFEVHEAANGSDGVQAVEQNDPVLVTVDLGLPDIDGYEVTRRVRRFSDAYVVMLTARTEEIDTLMGLDAGADDYLTKPFRPRELRARIEAMLRRPRALPHSPSVVASRSAGTDGPARQLGSGVRRTASLEGMPALDGPGSADYCLELNGLILFPNVHHVEVDDQGILLTPTEFKLLETLLRSGRVVRSKSELSRIIRGDDADSGTFVSESDIRTVEVHVGNMRRKLGEDSRTPRWIQTIRGVGYRAAGTAQEKI